MCLWLNNFPLTQFNHQIYFLFINKNNLYKSIIYRLQMYLVCLFLNIPMVSKIIAIWGLKLVISFFLNFQGFIRLYKSSIKDGLWIFLLINILLTYFFRTRNYNFYPLLLWLWILIYFHFESPFWYNSINHFVNW